MHFINPFKGLRPAENKASSVTIPSTDQLSKEVIANHTNMYREKFANPVYAAQRGFIDDVIMPNETRSRVCRGLELLEGKQLNNPKKKHGNIPL